MKRVGVIIGPALGHVARVLELVQTISHGFNVEVDLISPKPGLYVEKLFGSQFQTYLLPTENKNLLVRAKSFANGVEKLLKDKNYDLIIQDCNPFMWSLFTNFGDVPRIMVTNIFLTRMQLAASLQKQQFAEHALKINQERKHKGLPILESVFDLYEADKVILADPSPIVELHGPLPDNYECCGFFGWSQGGELPNELTKVRNILLLFMGSTGPGEISRRVLQKIRAFTKPDYTVYAGSKGESMQTFIDLDFCYEWLPLAPIFDKSLAVLTQGGAGSTYSALSRSLPVIVFPNLKNHALLGKIIQSINLGICIDEDFEVEKLDNIDFGEIQYHVKKFATEIKNDNFKQKLISVFGNYL